MAILNKDTEKKVEVVRKGSPTVALRSLKGAIKTLKELKMTTKEEQEELDKTYKNIFERWVALSLDM